MCNFFSINSQQLFKSYCDAMGCDLIWCCAVEQLDSGHHHWISLTLRTTFNTETKQVCASRKSMNVCNFTAYDLSDRIERDFACTGRERERERHGSGWDASMLFTSSSSSSCPPPPLPCIQVTDQSILHFTCCNIFFLLLLLFSLQMAKWLQFTFVLILWPSCSLEVGKQSTKRSFMPLSQVKVLCVCSLLAGLSPLLLLLTWPQVGFFFFFLLLSFLVFSFLFFSSLLLLFLLVLLAVSPLLRTKHCSPPM